MQEKISPVTAGIVVAIVVVLVLAIGWKLAFTPHGVPGKAPDSAANPNSYQPPPANAPSYSQPGQ